MAEAVPVGGIGPQRQDLGWKNPLANLINQGVKLNV